MRDQGPSKGSDPMSSGSTGVCASCSSRARRRQSWWAGLRLQDEGPQARCRQPGPHPLTPEDFAEGRHHVIVGDKESGQGDK